MSYSLERSDSEVLGYQVLLRALGKSPTQEDLQKLFAEIDPKGESNVDFKMLCYCMKKQMRAPDPENDVMEAFKYCPA